MIDLASNSVASHPDISIIIPTYNRVAMLEESLTSVLSQDFDGVMEVIVIDDNSSDGTAEVISRRYPGVKLLSLNKNVGAYAARNLGVKHSTGKHIAFLDSDDLWQPDYLKTQLAALAGLNKCFCTSALILWDTIQNVKTVDIQKPDLKKYTSPLHQLLVTYSFLLTLSSIVFPRSVFDEVGLFNEVRVSADAEMYLRCFIAGYQLVNVEAPLVIKRSHGNGQLTDAKNHIIRDKIRLLRVKTLYPLIAKQLAIAPIEEIYKEFYLKSLIYRELKRESLLTWFLATVSTSTISPKYTALCFTHEVKLLFKPIKMKLRKS